MVVGETHYFRVHPYLLGVLFGIHFFPPELAHLMIFAHEEAKAESAAISQPVVVNGSNQGGRTLLPRHPVP